MMEGHSIPRLMVAAPSSGSGKTTLACGLLRGGPAAGAHALRLQVRPRLHRPHVPPLCLRGAQPEPGPVFQLGGGDPLPAGFCRSGSRPGGAGGGSWAFTTVRGTPTGPAAGAWPGPPGPPSCWRCAPQGTALTLAALVKGGAGLPNSQPDRRGAPQRLHPAAGRAADPRHPGGRPACRCWGYLPQLPGSSIPSRHLGLFTPDEGGGPVRQGGPGGQSAGRDRRLGPDLRAGPLRPGAGGGAPAAPPGRSGWAPGGRGSGRGLLLLLRGQPGRAAPGRGPAGLLPAPPGTGPSRRGPAASIWGAATRSSTPGPLSENSPMGEAVRRAVLNGMPTLAECGGFLYLQSTLEDGEGTTPGPWPGCWTGLGSKTSRLQRFGYVTLTAQADSPYLKQGETMAAHEFHRWGLLPKRGAVPSPAAQRGRGLELYGGTRESHCRISPPVFSLQPTVCGPVRGRVQTVSREERPMNLDPAFTTDIVHLPGGPGGHGRRPAAGGMPSPSPSGVWAGWRTCWSEWPG